MTNSHFKKWLKITTRELPINPKVRCPFTTVEWLPSKRLEQRDADEGLEKRGPGVPLLRMQINAAVTYWKVVSSFSKILKIRGAYATEMQSMCTLHAWISSHGSTDGNKVREKENVMHNHLGCSSTAKVKSTHMDGTGDQTINALKMLSHG